MDDARDEGRPCSEPEHRQFDFWLGEWEVRDPEGTLVGHNRISRLFDGWACWRNGEASAA